MPSGACSDYWPSSCTRPSERRERTTPGALTPQVYTAFAGTAGGELESRHCAPRARHVRELSFPGREPAPVWVPRSMAPAATDSRDSCLGANGDLAGGRFPCEPVTRAVELAPARRVGSAASVADGPIIVYDLALRSLDQQERELGELRVAPAWSAAPALIA